MTHNNELIINGYKDTIKGRILDYYFIKEKRKIIKNSQKYLKIILNFKTLKYQKNILIQLKEKYNIKISLIIL